MSNVVGLPPPAPKSSKKTPPWKAFGALILVFFFIGLSIGACSLGMKLPVALYDALVRQ